MPAGDAAAEQPAECAAEAAAAPAAIAVSAAKEQPSSTAPAAAADAKPLADAVPATDASNAAAQTAEGTVAPLLAAESAVRPAPAQAATTPAATEESTGMPQAATAEAATPATPELTVHVPAAAAAVPQMSDNGCSGDECMTVLQNMGSQAGTPAAAAESSSMAEFCEAGQIFDMAREILTASQTHVSPRAGRSKASDDEDGAATATAMAPGADEPAAAGHDLGALAQHIGACGSSPSPGGSGCGIDGASYPDSFVTAPSRSHSEHKGAVPAALLGPTTAEQDEVQEAQNKAPPPRIKDEASSQLAAAESQAPSTCDDDQNGGGSFPGAGNAPGDSGAQQPASPTQADAEVHRLPVTASTTAEHVRVTATVPANGQARCRTADLCSTKATGPLSDPLQKYADEAEAPKCQQSQEEAAAALAESGECDKMVGEAGASTEWSGGAAQTGAADSLEGAPSDAATAAVRCKLLLLVWQALQHSTLRPVFSCDLVDALSH